MNTGGQARPGGGGVGVDVRALTSRGRARRARAVAAAIWSMPHQRQSRASPRPRRVPPHPVHDRASEPPSPRRGVRAAANSQRATIADGRRPRMASLLRSGSGGFAVNGCALFGAAPLHGVCVSILSAGGRTSRSHRRRLGLKKSGKTRSTGSTRAAQRQHVNEAGPAHGSARVRTRQAVRAARIAAQLPPHHLSRRHAIADDGGALPVLPHSIRPSPTTRRMA